MLDYAALRAVAAVVQTGSFDRAARQLAVTPSAISQRVKQLEERLGAVLAHSYGASEMGLVSILTPAEHDLSRPQRFTCAGRIREGVEIRFRRVEDNALAAPAEPGSIEVRSPAVAGGYRHRPELQAQAFKDGWYRSGDLGRVDDGVLTVLGRADDAISTGGLTVVPRVVEDVLAADPAVAQCAVVGVPDERLGEEIVALVVAEPGRTPNPESLRASVAQQVHRHAAPRRILVVDEIPLRGPGKIDRAAVRTLAARARAV